MVCTLVPGSMMGPSTVLTRKASTPSNIMTHRLTRNGSNFAGSSFSASTTSTVMPVANESYVLGDRFPSVAVLDPVNVDAALLQIGLDQFFGADARGDDQLEVEVESIDQLF